MVIEGFFCPKCIWPLQSGRCGSPSVWPDLAKFYHFGNNFKVFGNYKKLYLVFDKLLNLLWQIFYAIWPNLIVENCHKMKHFLAIWSPWHRRCGCVRRYEGVITLNGIPKFYFDFMTSGMGWIQCDHIGQFIGLWATF